MNYYVLTSDATVGGPFTATHMMELHRAHIIANDTPAAAAGDSSWHTFGDLLAVIQDDMANPQPGVLPDMEAQIEAARNSGPPTPHMLVNLLEEEGHYPARPRNRTREPHRPPPPIILNPRVRRIALPG